MNDTMDPREVLNRIKEVLEENPNPWALAPEEREKVQGELVDSLVQMRKLAPEGGSLRALITFNFAAMALEDAYRKEGNDTAADLLGMCMRSFAQGSLLIEGAEF